MNVRELKSVLAGANDEDPVLLEGNGHELFAASACVETAARSKGHGHRSYMHWDGLGSASSGEEPVQAVVIS